MKNYRTLFLLFFVAITTVSCRSLEEKDNQVLVIGPTSETGIEAYTVKEVGRVFKENLGVEVLRKSLKTAKRSNQNMVVIGTAENNPYIKQLLKDGFLEAESHTEGYSVKCAPHPRNPEVLLLAIAGADNRGVLYGLRDIEHYEMDKFNNVNGKLEFKSFSRADYPRIEHRGHWVWGVNMPDKKAWLDNMSKWKMNELIHWDNYPPQKAKEYVDYAHERGIRVVWGFGWGWNPDWNFIIPKEFDHGIGEGVEMCGSDEFNLEFFKREILKKVRTEYVPSGCDGIYFQSFTEVPKCECEQCKNKSKGEIMLEFVNPIVDAIKKEFPDLWISCGVHANLGIYDELKDLDPRCNIYWENCDSGTSIRGENEDFGYIYKKLPYGHGFSKTCQADPEYTEESLKEWMESNADRYAIKGDINTYYDYMKGLQEWSRGMLGKPSENKHGSTVADHSVFSRRTPFMHVALAEAMWNPNLDRETTVDGIIAFLQTNGGVPGLITSDSNTANIAQHDAIGKKVTLISKLSPKYTRMGAQVLTDGRKAIEPNAKDKAWVGCEKQDLNVVIDLEKAMSINSFSSGFLHQPEAGIYTPKQVEYSISYDGKTFEVVGIVDDGGKSNSKENLRKTYFLHGLDLYKVRFVRLRAKYNKHWILSDEILINPL